MVAIRLALWMVSLPRLLNWLTCRAPSGSQDPKVIEDMVYYVERWLELAPYHPKGNFSHAP